MDAAADEEARAPGRDGGCERGEGGGDVEAERKHAELIEQAASAEARVQNVVAQLGAARRGGPAGEGGAGDGGARGGAAEAAAAASKAAASEKADMVAELRALRAAAGIGDDGEELSEEQRLAAAAEFENAAQQSDMSAKDATALTSRLVKAAKAAEAARRVATDMETFKKIADERLRRIEELESQALDADATRRALHNQIQELRGNVRVFCPACAHHQRRRRRGLPAPKLDVTITKPGEQGEPAGFEFDRVFAPSSTQAEVFEEVSQLVQSALDGYKVCLFSYGQTGSGKTHTMLGEQGAHSENRGVIPRAVAKIVEASEANAKKGWTYELHASYVEIYNEQVRDLLNAGSGHSDKHAIVHVGGVTEVSGVRREPVTSVEAAAALVRRAANARAVEATQMNAVSSRSHTIFMLYVTGEHVASGSKLSGCLNLVDLAGSERVGRSGAEGARLKERAPSTSRSPASGTCSRRCRTSRRTCRTATPSSRTCCSRAWAATARRSCSSTSTPEAQRRGVGVLAQVCRAGQRRGARRRPRRRREAEHRQRAHAGEDGPHQGKRKAGGDEGRQGGQGAARLRRTRGPSGSRTSARARAERRRRLPKVQIPARAP